MDERGRIAMFARALAVGAPGVELGIGDDAAVLRPTGARDLLVWTIDEQVEGTHFRRAWVDWRDLGWRSYVAAVSDVAAMGAVPWCALAALVLPADVDDDACAEIARGQRAAADEVGAPFVGGNLARGPVLSIATTVLGTCARAIPRSGARAGDGLWLAGRVGLAAAGLRALERRRADDAALADAVAAWRRPRANVEGGRAMAGIAHAAIDVSDGLARDAGHIAEASHVALVIDAPSILADPALVRAAQVLGEDPVDLALHGGEDYALVAASDAPLPGFRRIGEVREGVGIVLRSPSGERAVEAQGFDHFRTGTSPGA
jgi:thiamine-monophosphate kinase